MLLHVQNWYRRLRAAFKGQVGPVACTAAFFLLFFGSPIHAQTITLSGTTSTPPFRDFATREMADPWDMSQRTDIGWFTWGVDSPPSNLTSLGIATDGNGNTYFKGQPTASDPWFFLLDSWTPGAAKLGKLGVNYPIDTTIYNTLYVKMKIANEVRNAFTVAQVVWSRDTIYAPPVGGPNGGQILAHNAQGNQAGVFLTSSSSEPFMGLEGGNWVIYKIPLTIAQMKQINPDIDHWQNVNGGPNSNWGDAGVTADSLRISPFVIGSQAGEVQIDWARLVSPSAGNAMTITWSGGARDIVVSTNSLCSDFGVIAYSQSSGYQFQTQVLPPGTYHVGLRLPFTRNTGHTAPTGSTLQSCSAGTFTVQSYPSLSMTSPSVEGSTDDFATTQLGDAWDFDSLEDFDWSRNANIPNASYGIVTRAATDAAGNDLGNVRVFRNRSTGTPGSSVVGDPHIYTLWPTPAQAGARTRGLHHRIDTSRYRIFTADLGVERTRDLNLGSIARIMWHVDGERNTLGNLAEIESSDIALRHLDPATQNGGKIVLDTIQVDMANRESLPIETDYPQPGSGWKNACTPTPGTTTCNTSGSGYTPGVNMFRLDFHEFWQATDSYVRRIKLAALERTGNSFTITWTPSNPSSLASTVTLKAVPVANAAAGNYHPADALCSTASSITIATGVPLANGSYSWSPGSTVGVTNGSEYYVCTQIEVDGAVVDEEMSRWPIVVDTAYTGPKPILQLDRSTLRFTGVRSGQASPVFSYRTPPETVRFSQSGAGTVNWTVNVVNASGAAVSWLTVSTTSGTGGGSFAVSLNEAASFPQCTTVGGLSAFIRLTSPDMGNDPQIVQVYATIYSGASGGGGCSGTSGATANPVGMMDTPTQSATGIVGSVGVTGWAVDDVGISSVRLYRNCLSFEPAPNCTPVGGLSLVYMGDADVVPGARPDVEAVYPTYPQNYRAGWGFLLLTNMLPHIPTQQMFGGQGTISIYAFATDIEGHMRRLGRSPTDQTPTTITMANDTAARPFGAIDTPGQGQTVSGTVVNFGWALTPDSDTVSGNGDIVIPTTGSTMLVWIDGAPMSTVTYDLCRGNVGSPVQPTEYCDDDVANIFGTSSRQAIVAPRSANPSRYRNLDMARGSIGAYAFDTTALSNGRHSIVWSVTDSAGRVDGIGSRDFIVFNGSGGSLIALQDAAAQTVGDVADVMTLPVDSGPVWGRSTFDVRKPWEAVEPSSIGSRDVRIPELGRVELYVGAAKTGYLVANGTLRPLPSGSQLRDGHFTWAPGPGYIGTYDLVFVQGNAHTPVRVTIVPNPAVNAPASIDAWIDLPATGSSMSGRFTVAGWAFERDAWQGSGIGAVHVWAQRRDVPAAAPIFLGDAGLNVPRPDVAAIHGTHADRSGWGLTAPALERGVYDITAYFWSHRTQEFEDARTVTITVR